MATMTMWIMSQGSGLVLALFPPSSDNPLPLLSTLDCQPPQIPPYSYCLYVYTLFLSFLAFSPGALCTSEKVRHFLIIVRHGIGASPTMRQIHILLNWSSGTFYGGWGGIASLVSVSIGKFQNYSKSRLGSLGKARVTQYGSSSGDKVTKRGDPTIWSCSDQNIAAGPESHWEDITGQDKGHQIWYETAKQDRR